MVAEFFYDSWKIQDGIPIEKAVVFIKIYVQVWKFV